MSSIQLNFRREGFFATCSLIVTSCIFVGIFHMLALNGYHALKAHAYRDLFEIVLFSTAFSVLAYSNLLYHICLVGYYKRRQKHIPASREELHTLYDGKAPALSILIPSYKEERRVIWQTMVSAALAEYPQKNVVLLIDNPRDPKSVEDQLQLEEARALPRSLQQQFDACAQYYRSAQAEFFARLQEPAFDAKAELYRLANLYENVATWISSLTGEFLKDTPEGVLPHGDRFFIDSILETPASAHRAFAEELRTMDMPSESFIRRHYNRLIGMFSINFHSFERKKYVNLSHEANKAMNLNSYMGLIGKSWREVETPAGLELVECSPEAANFIVADADYVNTIDADSLMLGEYALRLITIMERPDNRRLAVIQSPCSSFPNCDNLIERAAGACIDVQFRTHIGYTHWNATFWVGANAMLRRSALEDIRETHMEDGKTVSVYIQDRTVIEDTESTIDLVHKGWKLYNYPERMTFSATPPDYGSLLIQRRRWANGGLIILPKLLHYTWHARKNLTLCKEFFMRFHYLASTTTGCLAALILFCYPFASIASLPLVTWSAVPLLILYARDLKNTGYRYRDLPLICALNLMLLPISVGGVFKQFQQMITGEKIPFCRTPKIPGRTAAPAIYNLMAIIMPLSYAAICGHEFALLHWSQGVFALLNTFLLTYALMHFIGTGAALEDITAGVASGWRTVFKPAPTSTPAAPRKIPVITLLKSA